MDRRLQAAGVTAGQVQVVWLKQAQIGPAQLGEFPVHAESLRNDVATILRQLKTRFPNLRIAYLSSRIYAGYAATPLNPEPYAYESVFSVRWLIESQVANDPNLNYDPARGEVRAPLLLWGPYLWADGTKARQGDGLAWTRDDLGPDGTHPSPPGRQKVADLLLKFFQTDANTKSWFVKPKP
jgi:lysophospholipase L1-like esterase